MKVKKIYFLKTKKLFVLKKFKKKRKIKKKTRISNPKKKTIKLKFSKTYKSRISSKLEFKNTNIIINIGKNKKKEQKIFNERNNNKRKPTILMIKYKDCELNFLDFQKAMIYDKRTFFQYYLSLLKSNNLILFSFYPVNDYNIKIIKISIFFISFDIYFFINSLFFNNSTIHKIYEDRGVFNFSYFIPKIIYSFIISYYCIIIIKFFSLSYRNLLELKNEENKKKIKDLAQSVKRCLICKYITFYVLSFIFITFFWYNLSSFCAVYKNSQVFVIENTLISFGISLLYPFFFNFLPTICRVCSLKDKKTANKFLYKLSKFLQLL